MVFKVVKKLTASLSYAIIFFFLEKLEFLCFFFKMKNIIPNNKSYTNSESGAQST